MDYSQLYPFWTYLNPDEEEYIKSSLYTEKYDKGMIMHRSGENCRGLMTVCANDVCVLSASCLMDSIAFDVLVEAADMTEVLVIPSVCLNQVIKSNPYVELYLYKAAAEKFSEIMWTLQQIMFLKTDQRVARFLWDENIRSGSTELQITHDEIAKYIGSFSLSWRQTQYK